MTVWEDLRARFPEALITGGLEVTTTLDLDWQNAARAIAERRLAQLNDFSIDQIYHNATNAAIVALDPHTGQVLAMLGSPDYFDDMISGAVNMAVAPRQPGSALKPFTYALSFDPARPDPWTPATVLLDVRTAFVTRRLESYVPHNFSLDEHGPVRIREALANSYNIPAVIALDHLGVGALIDFLGALGITTLDDPGRYDLALTLGGGEVRLVELAGAYGTFANGGYLIPPALLLEVRDNAGNVLYRYEPPAEPPRVMDARVAWQITDILSDNAARMPAFGPNSVLNIGRPAAAKTGTTTDFRDNWTVGYTPNLVVGVWVGNTDHSPMIEVSGISGAGPIWHDFIREALKGQPELAFARPDGLIKVEVCELSGLLPTPECPRRVPEWFIKGTEPTAYDTFYRRAAIDAETGALATESTPPERIAERVYIVLPPEAREWAASQGIEPLPDEVPSTDGAPSVDGAESALAQGFGGLRLLAPDPYTVYTISPRTPIETQQIAISAGVSPGTHRVEYLLNGETIGAADSAPWEIWWQLEAGEHVLVAKAALADGTVERSEPVPFTVAQE
jgi:membrane carboxypeptidase/penicillin-binding protein PbpC